MPTPTPRSFQSRKFFQNKIGTHPACLKMEALSEHISLVNLIAHIPKYASRSCYALGPRGTEATSLYEESTI